VELWLIGGLHDGLMIRDRCVRWLRDQAGAHRRKPTFIAVEWGQAGSDALLSERPYLVKGLQSTWPAASNDVIEIAADSLCWEAEAAMTALRSSPQIVWLDEGINAALEAIPRDNPR